MDLYVIDKNVLVGCIWGMGSGRNRLLKPFTRLIHKYRYFDWTNLANLTKGMSEMKKEIYGSATALYQQQQ